jgi:hypothetical protein
MCFRKALLKAGRIESGQTRQVVGLSQKGNPKEPQIPILSKPTSGKPAGVGTTKEPVVYSHCLIKELKELNY